MISLEICYKIHEKLNGCNRILSFKLSNALLLTLSNVSY